MTETASVSVPARPLVLVADDETAIQALVARVIHRLGLVAVLVDDGAAAIAAVEVHRDNLACAILDIVMPVVNGVDAAYAIQRIAPELSIILMSGAIPARDTDRITRLGHAGTLHKPFPLAVLRDMIRQVVGQRSALGEDGSAADMAPSISSQLAARARGASMTK
jgi:CheY-like chemotaxis protein